MFLNTEEKQSIVENILNKIKCDYDFERITLDGRIVPNGRKLSNFKTIQKSILRELSFKFTLIEIKSIGV